MTDRLLRCTRPLALAALLLATAGGCRFRSLPAHEVYRLAFPDVPSSDTVFTDSTARGAALAGSIAIRPYGTPGIYGERAIVYRIGDTEYGSHQSREWALALGDMLGLFTETVLRARPLTRGPAVFDPPSARSLPYAWVGTVREFEEVNRGREVFAAVRVDALLVRSADDSVLWRGSARRERAVPPPQDAMSSVVRTMSDLAAEAIGGLAASADSAIRRGAVTPARSRP